MLEAPTSVLRSIVASGYQKKLAIAFTQFDLVRGQANLPTFDLQRDHVLSAVYQRLTSIREIVGVPAVRAIERDLDERCFMLGYLDRPLTERNRGPRKELLKLLDMLESAIAPEEIPQLTPVYDTAGLILAVQLATTDFHNRWDSILGFKSSSSVRTAHWARVKALNRRIAHDFDRGKYGDLKPVPDFIARLAESVTQYLANPYRWGPRLPSDDEEDEALTRVQGAVFQRLHGFVEARLLRIPRDEWLTACDFRGAGSTSERGRAIKAIYETSAPIPELGPLSGKFLRQVRGLIHDAIREGGGELVSDVLGSSEVKAEIESANPEAVIPAPPETGKAP